MKLTSKKDIIRNIKSAACPKIHNDLYQRMHFAFGFCENLLDAQEKCGVDDYSDGILRFPAFEPQIFDSGVTSYTLMHTRIAMSQMYARPMQPQYKGIDPIEAEFRKQVFLSDYHGWTGRYGFVNEVKQAGSGLDAIGVGAVLFGHQEDWESGKLRTFAQEVSALNCYWDRFYANPKRSRYCAFRLDVSVEEAEAFMKGVSNKDQILKNAKRYFTDVRDVRGSYQSTADQAEYVRLMLYYDYGTHEVSPTTALVVGELVEGNVIRHEATVYPKIPVAWGVGFIPPMSPRPWGRLDFEFAQEMIDRDILKAKKQALSRPVQDLIDPEIFDDDSQMTAFENGEPVVYVDTSQFEGREFHHRIGGQEIQYALQNLENKADRTRSATAATSDAERSSYTPGKRSATEASHLAAKAESGKQYLVQAILEFHEEIVRTHGMMMQYDQHPRLINMAERTYPVNDPSDPRSQLRRWFETPAEVYIDVESITADDDRMETIARREGLKELIPWVQSGVVPAEPFIEDFVKSISGIDPKRYLGGGQAKAGVMDKINQAGIDISAIDQKQSPVTQVV